MVSSSGTSRRGRWWRWRRRPSTNSPSPAECNAASTASIHNSNHARAVQLCIFRSGKSRSDSYNSVVIQRDPNESFTLHHVEQEDKKHLQANKMEEEENMELDRCQ